MYKMTPSVEQWSLYSAAQNLPAVLNDPNKGKQTNFFVKTWGDAFVEKTTSESSPFLPDISYSHFDSYIRKIGKRHRKHLRLNEREGSEQTESNISDRSEESRLSNIPEIFLKSDFPLNDPTVFNTVFPGVTGTKVRGSGHQLQEELSHYLDVVEVEIAKQVSQKSGAFFHAMTSHDTIMEKMGTASREVQTLRKKVQMVDRTLAKDRIKLLRFARSRSNANAFLDKLKLMSTVLQTQPTLQILLSSSDYVGALELISGTQDVLARELAGVTSLRHLPSQLKEMSRLIDKMLSTEFERYAAADLHRPLDDGDNVLEPERLTSLVAGLLRQNHLQFVEIYKQEAVTAAQTLLKQLMIEQLADVEDGGDGEHYLIGSGESSMSFDTAQWVRVLQQAGDALGKLIHRVVAVHNIIQHTVDISAGLTPSNMKHTELEVFLTAVQHERAKSKLYDLLISVCDYCMERLSSLINSQADKQNVTISEISDLSVIVENFSRLCENVCGKPRSSLESTFKLLAGNYIHKFHTQKRKELTLLLDSERWKVAEIPPEFQTLVDKLASGKPLTSSPTSPSERTKSANALIIGSQQFVTVGTVLMLVKLVVEYLIYAYDLPKLSNVIGRNLAELLRTFNSRACQLVLGAGALKTAGLKTITSTNLALTSRALQLVMWMIPLIRMHLRGLNADGMSSLDAVEADIGNHIQQLETKILSIVNSLLTDQLNDWDAKPPVPSKAFRNISKQLGKLHEAVSSVLPPEQVGDIYEVVHRNFKSRLKDQVAKLNIQNNGGPQHGVVMTEMMFYFETMKSLKVLPEKYFSDKSIDNIWNR